MRLALVLALATPALGWWRDEDVKSRGAPPYPYPATHKDGTVLLSPSAPLDPLGARRRRTLLQLRRLRALGCVA